MEHVEAIKEEITRLNRALQEAHELINGLQETNGRLQRDNGRLLEENGRLQALRDERRTRPPRPQLRAARMSTMGAPPATTTTTSSSSSSSSSSSTDVIQLLTLTCAVCYGTEGTIMSCDGPRSCRAYTCLRCIDGVCKMAGTRRGLCVNCQAPYRQATSDLAMAWVLEHQ